MMFWCRGEGRADAARSRSVLGMTRIIPSLLVFFTLVPVAANALNPALCNDDAVTELPAFAEGRDSNQCLMVDPGNGDPDVPFQWDVFHKRGISVTALDSGESPGVDVIDLYKDDICAGSQTCSFMVWDTVFDNYLTSAGKNDDVIFWGTGQRAEYVYFKNSKVLNGWKCDGGSGWSGPNGTGCGSGEDSDSHSDGIQLRGQPVNGGWFIMQDSVFANGYNLHFLQQVGVEMGPPGSLFFQGVLFGRVANAGAAANWAADCAKRQGSDGSNGDICPDGRSSLDTDMNEVWLIDVTGTTRMTLKGNYNKVVVINTSPQITYARGWAWPLYGEGTGPNSCPNSITPGNCGGSGNTGKCYCYTSIENMLADRTSPGTPHKRPPFMHLSSAGWKNPPTTAGPPPTTPQRPNPVVLQP